MGGSSCLSTTRFVRTKCLSDRPQRTIGGAVMEFRTEQMDRLAHAVFIEKLDAAFSRDLPDFKEIDRDERHEFLSLAIAFAETKGLRSEQGLASYALALWYLGVDFEEQSKELAALLESSYPEVRKVHAMNEWVEAVTGDPDDITAADKAMKRALELTEAWGTE